MIRSATSAKAEASIAYTRFAPARGRHREDGGGGPEVHDDVDGTHSLLDRTNQGERAIAVVEQLDVHLDTAPRQAKIPTLSRSLGTIGERAEIPEPGNEAARLDPVETGGPDARPLLNDVAKWSRRLRHRSEASKARRGNRAVLPPRDNETASSDSRPMTSSEARRSGLAASMDVIGSPG
jgi:hypothetical protein